VTPTSRQLDALAAKQRIERRLVDLTSAYSFLRDPALAAACEQLWRKPDGLVSEIWIEPVFAPQPSTDTLETLYDQGVLHANLYRCAKQGDVFPIDRVLHHHQAEAIRLARTYGELDRHQPACVITAGTGAGKTEAFLIPLLNELFHRPRRDGETGARAIILYPMNALVNDQIGRLERWLKHQTTLTFCHFTGETPESVQELARSGIVAKSKDPRLRSRDRIRADPPDILVTNYSMLEYMLCRPQDVPLFGSALQALVLDEVHLYSGALAAEISLLIKRTLVRCGRSTDSILNFATSATLEGDVHRFVSELFQKDLVKHLPGRPARAAFAPAFAPAIEPSVESLLVGALDELVLLQGDSLKQNGADEARRALEPLVDLIRLPELMPLKAGAEVLWQALARSPLAHRLEALLWGATGGKMLRLSDISEGLWHRRDASALRASVKLLQLGARARRRAYDLPLIPHKMHMQVRAATSLVACLNPECACEGLPRFPGGGLLSMDGEERCRSCGCMNYSLARCEECGEAVIAGIESNEQLLLRHRWTNEDSDILRFAAFGYGESSLGLRERTIGFGAGEIRVAFSTSCPNCLAEESFRPIGILDALALPLLAESTLAEMPELAVDHQEWLPAKGRRLLVFSDSRRDAARLGPQLTSQHELHVARRMILECVNQFAPNESERAYISKKLALLEEELAIPELAARDRRLREQQSLRYELLAFDTGESMQQLADRLGHHSDLSQLFARQEATQSSEDWGQLDWNRNRKAIHPISLLARELAVKTPICLESLGLVEIRYPGLESLLPPPQLAHLSTVRAREGFAAVWGEFLASLCDTLRKERAITVTEEFDGEGSIPLGKWVSERRRGAALGSFIGSLEGDREASRNRLVRHSLVELGVAEAELQKNLDIVLESAFKQLLDGARNGQLPFLEFDRRQAAKGQPVDALRIKFRELYVSVSRNWFQCRVTGRVWPRSVFGCVPDSTGRTELSRVSRNELYQQPRYARLRNLYERDPVMQEGLWADEHSAQLASRKTAQLQRLFDQGARNILSATTTLEVGIDVAGLSGVLLANVPPSRSNYQQRGGRAGRRADGSSLVVMFTRSSAYDQAAFRNFDEWFARRQRQVSVLLNRPRFARQHLAAFLLGEFFRRAHRPGDVAGAMKAYGLLGWFVGVPELLKWDKGVSSPPEPSLRSYAGLHLPLRPHESPAYCFQRFLLADMDTTLQHQAQSLLEGTGLSEYRDSKRWPELVSALANDFNELIESWKKEYMSLVTDWKRLAKDGHLDPYAFGALHYQAKALWSTRVIEELANGQFLPRYGFPIGVLSLTEPGRRDYGGRTESPVQLKRPGVLAVSEYVPGSVVLVGGRYFESRGLVKSYAKDDQHVFGTTAKKWVCQAGHTNYRRGSGSTQTCQSADCRKPTQSEVETLLFVRQGFSTAAWDPPSWYGKSERIGSTVLGTESFVIGQSEAIAPFAGVPAWRALFCENGKLLVSNSGAVGKGFAICTKCGLTQSEKHRGQKAKVKLPSGFETHTALERRTGTCEFNSVLRNQHLAAEQVTDLLRIDFAAAPAPAVVAIGYALVLAGAEMLEIDPRELGVFAEGYSAILFESNGSGGGHLKEIAEQSRAWCSLAHQRLFHSAPHHSVCERGCLTCILTPSSQAKVECGAANRRLAEVYLRNHLEPA